MRYAIVTETWPPEVNGVALTVAGFVQGLRSRGHAVSVVRPEQPGSAHARGDLVVPGAGLPRYPGLRFGMPAGRRLRRVWRRARPDAIYVATEGPLGWSALGAARALGIPAATGFHTRFDTYMRDYGMPWLAPAALAWMRRFHNRADRTLVATRELQEFLQSSGFRHAAVMARAVDTERFDPSRRDPALRAGWGLGDDGLALVHVGRIAPEKNLGLAVRAFRELQRMRPGARFVLVGDGPARESLQREHPDLLFRGVQRGEALARYFASADLFVFPSLSETFGNVTLEALASGVPTVAFDYGAAREHLRHGIDGARIGAGDEDGFVRAVVELGTDDARRAAMRAAAPDAVADLRPGRVAAHLDELLQSLANRGDRAHGPSFAT